MNGGKIVLRSLKNLGVKDIFGYPGGAVIPLYNELFDQYDNFNHYRSAHEQGAVHAADGYARSTGNVGVCFVTSGPGATNTVTGIATAYMDSVPLVVISGQVPSKILGKDSFQEIDITGVTMSITKHNFLVEDISNLEKIIKEAFKIAENGRPGPVLIDIPKDIFNKETKYLDIKLKKEYQKKTNNKLKVQNALREIINSKKPVIYAGGGVKASNAEKELLEFSEKLSIPVVNTLMGLGNFPRDHKNSLGLVGMHGFTEANLAIMNSDLIIAIGARFSDRVIGDPEKFAKNAKVIHIDIDSTELDKNIFSEIKIESDAKDVLKIFNQKIEKNKSNEDWLKEIDTYKEKRKFSKKVFHPENILETVNKNVKKDSIVVTDVGQHQMWTAQYWNFQTSDSFITSGGLGTMGFGLGAALGAKAGNKDRTVVLVTGDGSFRMNCNELSVINKYDLPILIILINNNTLGMVRQWQKMFQDKRYAETTIDDDLNYQMLAKAYNIDSKKVNNINDLKSVMDNYNQNKPLLLECNIDIDENVLPIIPPGKAINNFIL